jgi:hypothetical protein
METEGSLPCSQGLELGPYPEPDESSYTLLPSFLKFNFRIISATNLATCQISQSTRKTEKNSFITDFTYGHRKQRFSCKGHCYTLVYTYEGKSKSKGIFFKKKRTFFCKYTETKLISLFDVIPLDFNAPVPAFHNFFYFARK